MMLQMLAAQGAPDRFMGSLMTQPGFAVKQPGRMRRRSASPFLTSGGATLSSREFRTGREEPMRTRSLAVALWAADLVLLTAAYVHELVGAPSYTFGALFGLDREFTVPAAYSGLKFALLALVLAALSGALERFRSRCVLLGLACLFLVMAVDELGGIHERLTAVVRRHFLDEEAVGNAAEYGIALHGLVVTVPAAALLGVLYLVLRAVWKPLRVGIGRFGLGLAIFLSGSVLCDSLLGGMIAHKPTRTLLEEGSEFVGVTLMITAVLAAIAANAVRIEIGSGIHLAPLRAHRREHASPPAGRGVPGFSRRRRSSRKSGPED